MATYLDVLCNRLVFQPMQPAERDALIKFLGAKPDTRVTDANLGGKLPIPGAAGPRLRLPRAAVRSYE